MANELKQAIALIKAGENAKGRERLVAILNKDPKNDQAWVWLATVVDSQHKRECLEEALKHNPRNKMARRALERMKPAVSAAASLDAIEAQAKKPSALAHVLCGWPLVLVFFGGAIGGGLGGLAYGVNLAIYRMRVPFILKLALIVIVGAAAVVGWYVVVRAILSAG